MRVPQQLAGVAAVGCGATYGIMERCNFACTSCYLSDMANATEPLPFHEIQAQLRELRHYLGEGGKVQITSGEVTLLPTEELGRIVSCAKQMGLDPMVMTNGERWRKSPHDLVSLVADHGLEKVSIHIDTTQRGRRGMSVGASEKAIQPIRDELARLVRNVRKTTGRPLHAAQTITVNDNNLEDVPYLTRWALEHADAFRIVSFLPAAPVGRTEDRATPRLTLDTVWSLIEEGVGRPLNRHAVYFGHSSCNITVPVLVVSFGEERRVVEVVREGKVWDLRAIHWAIRELNRPLDLNDGLGPNLVRALAILLSRPHRLLELVAYGLYRLWGERSWLLRLALGLVRIQGAAIQPLLLVVHGFMSPEELETPLGQERLRACVFRVPVDGEMISMCEVNATSLRRELDARSLRGTTAPRPFPGRSSSSRTA